LRPCLAKRIFTDITFYVKIYNFYLRGKDTILIGTKNNCSIKKTNATVRNEAAS